MTVMVAEDRDSRLQEGIAAILDSISCPDGPLGYAGYIESGVIHGTHVTDDPLRATAVLRSGIPIADGRDEGKYGDLGPGLYMSAAPQLWTCRSIKKYDFLYQITRKERERLALAILAHDNVSSPAYLSAGERDVLKRDAAHYVDTGNPGFITFAAGQPYNIFFWEPRFLQTLGITPSPQPVLVGMAVRGKFAEFTRHQPDHVISMLRDKIGIDGAFCRGSFTTLPQLVTWKNEAVIKFGTYGARKARGENSDG